MSLILEERLWPYHMVSAKAWSEASSPRPDHSRGMKLI